MTRMRLVLAAVGGLALLAAGCGTDTPTDTADEPSEDSQPDDPETDETDETDASETDEASDADSDGSPSLEDLMARFGDGPMGPGQVVYEWEVTGMPDGARMTVALDPPDTAVRWESDDGDFLTIAGEVNTVCFGADGEWQCMAADMGLGGGLMEEDPFEDIVELDDIDDLGFDPATVTTTSETIVGRAAVCISVPETEDVTDMVVCVDEETGIMLRASGGTPDGTYRIDAVSFSDPDPDLFVPPAEPMDLPTG